MSTKNISRTAIEGGRDGSWSVSVKEAEKVFRRKNRVRDEDQDYPEKPRNLSKREHQTDHLNPVLRFLVSRVGKNWNQVWSEVKKRFDARTIAGQHVMGHIQNFFDRNDRRSIGAKGLYVNDQNVLCQEAPRAKRRVAPRVKKEDFDVMEKFIDGRCIRVLGSKYFWMIPVSPIRFIRRYNEFYIRTESAYRLFGEETFRTPEYSKPCYRQGNELKKDEVETLLSFPRSIIKSITV